MLRTRRQRTVLTRSCAIAKVADVIGDPVSILIVRDLLENPKGFTELELSLQGMSSGTICAKLKSLEKAGLVDRVPKPDFYPRVDWCLTKKGRALKPVIDSMRVFGKQYL